MKERDRHLFGPGPKRILSLDGGGVRGLVTLGMLKRAETLLAARSPDPQAFRLSDYFDLIGGTSTGAIIATQLAFGRSVDEVAKVYFDFCPRVFARRNLLSYLYLRSRFDSEKFRRVLNRNFDQLLRDLDREDLLAPPGQQRLHEEPTVGSELLRTGLAIVCKRIDTNSVWVLSNNPRAKFWDPKSEHWAHVLEQEGMTGFIPNRDYSLRRVVQASAAAPYYLESVEVQIDEQQIGLFLDGGASPFNNPSMELFLMATLKAYDGGGNGRGVSPHGFGWETGKDQLFMLSLGTGTWKQRYKPEEFRDQVVARRAITALTSMIGDNEQNALTWMQALSEPRVGSKINVNLGAMQGLRVVEEPLLTFRQLTPRLEHDWLENELGPEFTMTEGELKRTREFDWPAKRNLDRLHAIGLATGEKFLDDADFPPAFDIGPELVEAAVS